VEESCFRPAGWGHGVCGKAVPCWPGVVARQARCGPLLGPLTGDSSPRWEPICGGRYRQREYVAERSEDVMGGPPGGPNGWSPNTCSVDNLVDELVEKPPSLPVRVRLGCTKPAAEERYAGDGLALEDRARSRQPGH
jgi:hypothetical protein